VRKALAGLEIATVQTTAIDKGVLIRLTTTLAIRPEDGCRQSGRLMRSAGAPLRLADANQSKRARRVVPASTRDKTAMGRGEQPLPLIR
jgi:hypothetical protein